MEIIDTIQSLLSLTATVTLPVGTIIIVIVVWVAWLYVRNENKAVEGAKQSPVSAKNKPSGGAKSGASAHPSVVAQALKEVEGR